MSLIQAVFVSLCFQFLTGSVTSQVLSRTFVLKDDAILPCGVDPDPSNSYTWSDQLATRQVIYVVNSNHPATPVSKDVKYANFSVDVSSFPTSVPLTIRTILLKDEGVYRCSVDIQNYVVNYDVHVEVTGKVTIKHGSQDLDELTVTVGESYNLTCSATGTRSVNNLTLTWDPLVEKIALDKTSKISNGTYADYSLTTTYTAVQDVNTIKCQLSGFAVQDIDPKLISHTVNLTVEYTPQCTLLVPDDCRNVKLTCECRASPSDITKYSLFNESTLIDDKTTTNKFTLNVDYGTMSVFSCSATNAVGPGDKSSPKNHDCDKATEERPTVNLGDPEGPTTGLSTLVIIVIICSVLGVGAGGSVVAGLYVKKKSLSTRAIIGIIVVVVVVGGVGGGVMLAWYMISKEIWCFAKKGGNVDKPDDNGASCGVDLAEIPADGVIDKGPPCSQDSASILLIEARTIFDGIDEWVESLLAELRELFDRFKGDGDTVDHIMENISDKSKTRKQVVTMLVHLHLIEIVPDMKRDKSDKAGDNGTSCGVNLESSAGGEIDNDKPDDNGASRGVDLEAPTYGKIDKNRKKKKDGQNDPTPAPRNSKKEPSNSAKNDSLVQMQEEVVLYADLDHSRNKPSNKIRMPKDEPTVYATFQ